MESVHSDVLVAFEYYIVQFVEGYLTGKPPQYNIAKNKAKNEAKDNAKGDLSEKYQAAIDYIRRYNDDAATFTEVMHNFLTTAAAYLYITENEDNEIVYTPLDSRNTICIYDFGTPPYPIALIRVSEKKVNGKTEKRIEITTEASRRIFGENGEAVSFDDFGEDGRPQTVTEKPLYWGDVPVVPFEGGDGIAIFEPAVGLVDVFENLITNLRNMTAYNDKAKLVMAGFTPEEPDFIQSTDSDGKLVKTRNPARAEEDKNIYEAPTLYVPEAGSIDWLIKSVDYTGILDILQHLEKLIATVTTVPSTSDLSSPNASGVALGYTLYPLDQSAATIDRIFRKGYQRLWEIVSSRLNLKNNTNYDFRDIDIVFVRNTPTDRDQNTNMAIAAKGAGILSTETAITKSGYDIDPQAEVARIEAERIRPKDPSEISILRNAGILSEETAVTWVVGEDNAKEELMRIASEDLGVEEEAPEEETQSEQEVISQ